MFDDPEEFKIVPYIPFYAQPGCSTVQTWYTDFIDKVGNRATLTNIEYRDKKGKLHKAVIRVRWLQE